VTPAGLLLGLRALGRETRVVGITPIEWDEERHSDIARIANATASLLNLELEINETEVLNFNAYIGERYGVVTAEGRAAFKLLAGLEGIILDPVYTSKAMAGLLDHIEQGRVRSDEVVVFVHTGGVPAVFSYAEDLLA
jgi:1-aminocyclopropane-1-carboxylate deaminase/D-cysteine desulfhydrase-like pyridoxal-dependent ACC family enzyme